MRTVLRALGFTLLGLLAALLLAEGIMRIYLDVLPGPAKPVYLADQDTGYRLSPESAAGDTAGASFHVNALGFRDTEHPAQKPAGTRRILGIGDSFVLGEVPMKDNFLKVAERGLGTAGREPSPYLRTETVLLGLGGYSPQNYVGVLRSVGLPLKPDYALLCFYVGNDVSGIPARGRVLRGQLYTVGSYNPWLNAARQSRLFVFLERQILFRLRRGRVRERQVVSDQAPAEVPRRISRFYLALQRNRLPLYLRQPPLSLENLWREAEGYLKQFDQLCRSAQVPWALVVIPDEIQVDQSLRGEIMSRLGCSEEMYDFAGPQRRLKDFATRRSVPLLDLLPLFREAARTDSSLYFAGDTHWSVRGNRLAGAALSEFLQVQFLQLDTNRPAKGSHRKKVSEAPPDSLRRSGPSPPAKR